MLYYAGNAGPTVRGETRGVIGWRWKESAHWPMEIHSTNGSYRQVIEGIGGECDKCRVKAECVWRQWNTCTFCNNFCESVEKTDLFWEGFQGSLIGDKCEWLIEGVMRDARGEESYETSWVKGTIYAISFPSISGNLWNLFTFL